MLIAAIGDVQGRATLLRTALEAIADEGILTIVQTGNLMGEAHGDAVAALLKDHGVQVAQGEADRQLLRFEQKRDKLESKLEPEDFARLAQAHEALSSEGLEYLRGLHKRIQFNLEGVKALACHGSPSSQEEILSGESSHLRLQRLRESTGADLLICGGAPQPFHRWVDGALFAGPGNLDNGQGRAQYLVFDTDAQPWRVDLRVI